MSAISDNLETLRAYPLTAPGSAASDNVEKLRRMQPESLKRESLRQFPRGLRAYVKLIARVDERDFRK